MSAQIAFTALLVLLLKISQISSIVGAAEVEVDNNGASATMISDEVNIYDPASEKIQQIPQSYTENWPMWTLYAGRKKEQLVEVPLNNEDGYVNPVSFESLWIPHDLEYPQMRLGLGLHIREGVIRQIMPAVDLSFDRAHHNRGLSSVVRARKWVEFSSDDWSKYELVVMQRKLKAVAKSPLEMITSSSVPVEPYLERSIEYLTTNAPEEWRTGSHIVNVILEDSGVMTCPKVGYQLIANLNQGAADTRGQLDVKVSAVQAGSKSHHLPDVYISLFGDKKYQRKSYFDYLKKKEATQEKLKVDAAQAVREAREKEDG